MFKQSIIALSFIAAFLFYLSAPLAAVTTTTALNHDAFFTGKTGATGPTGPAGAPFNNYLYCSARLNQTVQGANIPIKFNPIADIANGMSMQDAATVQNVVSGTYSINFFARGYTTGSVTPCFKLFVDGHEYLSSANGNPVNFAPQNFTNGTNNFSVNSKAIVSIIGQGMHTLQIVSNAHSPIILDSSGTSESRTISASISIEQIAQ